jgi:hypothetical protein
MSANHNEGDENMCMLKNLKTHDKKCSIKYHNLHDKNTILQNFNIFNAMVNLHSCFVFQTHFH